MPSSPFDDVISQRLLLRLVSPKAVEACLAGNLRTAGKLLGATIPNAMLKHTSGFKYGQKQLLHDPEYESWAARALILPQEQTVIGLIRFHSRPDPDYLHPHVRDAVEFGYSIFTDYRRLGYATEAIKAMMNWAQTRFNVHKFVVSVSPKNKPSMQLAHSLGFIKIGKEMDEVDGIEYILLYNARD